MSWKKRGACPPITIRGMLARHAVATPLAQSLDDGAGQCVHDRLQPDGRRELLPDHRQRRAGRLADAQRQVPGFAAHRDDEVPPRRGLRVDHQVLDDLDAVVARRLEPERVDVRRQLEVVVDRLRHVHDANASGGLAVERHRGERRVVAADRQQPRDVEAEQGSNRVLEVLGVRVRVGARDPDVRSAAKVNAAHRLDRQRDDVIDVASHDPLEPVANAEHVDPFEPGPNGRRPDHAVDAGRRSAADENGQRMGVFHCNHFNSPA